MSRRNLLLNLVLLAMLAACAAPTDPAPTPTVPPTAAPTSTRAATETRSPPTRTPGYINTTAPTYSPPTPDFLNSPVADGFLLSSSTDPDCQLPCWQGLRVGVSDAEDVRAFFEDVLDVTDVAIRTGLRQGEYSQAVKQIYFSNTETYQHDWIVDLDWRPSTAPDYLLLLSAPPSYGLYMVVDSNAGLLRGILMNYVLGMAIGENNVIAGPGYYEITTAQGFLRDQGQPDWVYANESGTLTFFYKEGVAAEFAYALQLEVRTISDEDHIVSDLCLDEQPVWATDYLVEPFDDPADEASLNAIQRSWIFAITEHPRFGPLEEKLGISIPELTELAVQDQVMPCIVIDYGSSDS